MNDLRKLTKTVSPWVHLWPGAIGDVWDKLTHWEAESSAKRLVRFVRGKQCVNRSEFFHEVAAALQFPPYFGGNWDAFAECFSDWRRYSEQTAIVVCFANAGRLFIREAEAVGTFAEIAMECLQNVNAPAKPNKPRPMHLVMNVSSGKEDVFRTRWTPAGLVIGD